MTTTLAGNPAKFAGGWRGGRPVDAGAVAADHGYRAVVRELAGDSAAGARRDSRPLHQLLALPGGMRGARAVRRRATGFAAPACRRTREPRRVVRLRIDGAPSAVSSGAREARAGEGSHRARWRDAIANAAPAKHRGARSAPRPHGFLDLSPRHGRRSTNGVYLGRRAAGPAAAVDLAKARTVLSLGVPVLDGWGTPGNVHRRARRFPSDSG